MTGVFSLLLMIERMIDIMAKHLDVLFGNVIENDANVGAFFDLYQRGFIEFDRFLKLSIVLLAKDKERLVKELVDCKLSQSIVIKGEPGNMED